MAKGNHSNKHAIRNSKNQEASTEDQSPTMADRADKFDCYLQSVQEPEHEVDMFNLVYNEINGRKPLTLREDFCGTFAVCCDWVKSDKKRQAWAVDLSEETLQWGKQNNLGKLKPAVAERVEVLQQDVREGNTPPVDVLAAQNFSFWCFKTRPELLDYFKKARANLADDGLMIMDMMGGQDCYDTDLVDKRTIVKGKKGFKYHWEQAYFNPVNADVSFYIHFKFGDGSKLKRAFEYHWRFWTIPEVRELLIEAGFSEALVYWDEEEDDDKDARWVTTEEMRNDASWICYIVARK